MNLLILTETFCTFILFLTYYIILFYLLNMKLNCLKTKQKYYLPPLTYEYMDFDLYTKINFNEFDWLTKLLYEGNAKS